MENWMKLNQNRQTKYISWYGWGFCITQNEINHRKFKEINSTNPKSIKINSTQVKIDIKRLKIEATKKLDMKNKEPIKLFS